MKPVIVTWDGGVGVGRVVAQSTTTRQIGIQQAGEKWEAFSRRIVDGEVIVDLVAPFNTREIAAGTARAWVAAAKAAMAKAGQQVEAAAEVGVDIARQKCFEAEFPSVTKLVASGQEITEAEFRSALRCDRAEQTGNVPAGAEVTPAIAAALRRHRRHPRQQVNLRVDLELALRWESAGYSRLTARELAARFNVKFKAGHTAESIRKRLKRLGLLTRRHPGPGAD